MTAPAPKSWFTAAELADLALPGLPSAKRKVNELASHNRWALQIDRAGAPLTRPRAGRGGGVEYHYSLLPPAAVTALVRRGELQPQLQVVADAPLSTPRDQLWAWFDRQSDSVKGEARRRAAALDDVAALERSGPDPHRRDRVGRGPVRGLHRHALELGRDRAGRAGRRPAAQARAPPQGRRA